MAIPYDEDTTRPARLFVCLLTLASFSSRLSAQPCSRFDVASIKLHSSGAGGSNPELAPGARRFTAVNQHIIELIMFAYDVTPRQILGIPASFPPEKYDIEATCETPITEEQLPHLMQILLAERFHMSVHRESKEQPVYALIVGKGGPRFHESSHAGDKPGFRQSADTFTFTNAPMSTLLIVLSQVSGRKVVDRTGLTGQYDFTLSYAPDRRDGPGGAPAPDGAPESVFTALREQLGLNLQTERSQVEFVVIDRLDPLSPN